MYGPYSVTYWRNFKQPQLCLINSCQQYLQVILFSDITTADGRHILLSIIKVSRAAHRTSTLQWSKQDTPPDRAWSQWRLVLKYISTNSKLHISLGNWLTMPHQQWNWFTDISFHTVYLQGKDNSWTTYQQVPSPLHSTRNTHRMKIWYNKDTCFRSDPSLWPRVPTMVYTDKRYPGFFHAVHSSNASTKE